MSRKESELYIGLMCGTSADGIDAALVKITHHSQPQLIATHVQALPTQLRGALLTLNNEPNVSLRQLSQLDTQVAQVHCAAVCALLAKSEVAAEQIRAVGFHGQTIDHAPNAPVYNTTQIGNAHILAAETHIPVIGDVRRADIAAGGQGAPLAPALHNQLLSAREHDVAVVNIGGIANLSLLPSDAKKPVIGFDTGPGNCLMDEWAKKHLNKPYDPFGQFAQSGLVDQPLLAELLSLGYFSQKAPKSTGRDLFNLNWLQQRLAGKNIGPADVQATLSALTAQSICDALKQNLANASHLYVCGGGAQNTHLMSCLRQLLPSMAVESTLSCGIEPDWMEAILMAWLARQYCLNLPGNLPSVTGAKALVRLGVRFDPPRSMGEN